MEESKKVSQEKAQVTIVPPRKQVFDGEFFKYWHFVKVLSEEQRQLLASTLSKEEQKDLTTSYQKGGWKNLFMRDACDQVLDSIKQKFGVDWLSIKGKILNGKPQLVQKSFWAYLNACFDGIEWDHIAYIFDGLISREYDSEYVKISLFVPPPAIEDGECEVDPNDTKGE